MAGSAGVDIGGESVSVVTESGLEMQVDIPPEAEAGATLEVATNKDDGGGGGITTHTYIAVTYQPAEDSASNPVCAAAPSLWPFLLTSTSGRFWSCHAIFLPRPAGSLSCTHKRPHLPGRRYSSDTSPARR